MMLDLTARSTDDAIKELGMHILESLSNASPISPVRLQLSQMRAMLQVLQQHDRQNFYHYRQWARMFILQILEDTCNLNDAPGDTLVVIKPTFKKNVQS